MGLSFFTFVAALAAVLGSEAPALTPAAPATASELSRAYIGGFCGPIVLGESDETALMSHLASWGAKPLSDAEGDAARPEDIDLPGQLFRFSRPNAPSAFVERRRGECALVFRGATTPASVVQELTSETLPVGEHGTQQAWRRVSRNRFGPPMAPKYFVKVGDSDGFGLCSVLYEDLRLRDGSAATVAKVSVCRLLKDEKIDNG